MCKIGCIHRLISCLEFSFRQSGLEMDTPTFQSISSVKTNIGRSYAFRSVFSTREVGEASFG